MDQGLKKEALEFARSSNVSVIATVSKEGKPNARVMQTVRIDDDFTLWYVTDAPSAKVCEARHQPQVCILMSNYKVKCDIRYYGVMSVISDQKTKDAFWKDEYQVFFKGGKTDPTYVVLKFVSDAIEYRDMSKYGHDAKKLK